MRPENNFSKNREREITFTEIREREIRNRECIYIINTCICDACKQCYNTKFDKAITLCCLYHETRVFACPGRGQ